MYALSVDSNLYTDGAGTDNVTHNRVSSCRGLQPCTGMHSDHTASPHSRRREDLRFGLISEFPNGDVLTNPESVRRFASILSAG